MAAKARAARALRPDSAGRHEPCESTRCARCEGARAARQRLSRFWGWPCAEVPGANRGRLLRTFSWGRWRAMRRCFRPGGGGRCADVSPGRLGGAVRRRFARAVGGDGAQTFSHGRWTMHGAVVGESFHNSSQDEYFVKLFTTGSRPSCSEAVTVSPPLALAPPPRERATARSGAGRGCRRSSGRSTRWLPRV